MRPQPLTPGMFGYSLLRASHSREFVGQQLRIAAALDPANAAVHRLLGRILSQQTLDADKKKLDLGAGTPYQVVQDERDLASAQSSETQAMANYTHARIAFDLAMGRTLEVNHISMEEALAGQVQRESIIPTTLKPSASHYSKRMPSAVSLFVVVESAHQ